MHEHIFGLTDAASLRRAQWQGPLPATLLGRDALLVRQFQEAAPWGLDMALDLFGCDPVPMRNRDLIVAFTMALCDQLQMRRSGEPLLVHSGPDERARGFSLVQLIEHQNALIAQCIDHQHAICLNVISCRSFAPYQAAVCCQEWFSASAAQLTVTFRGVSARAE